MLGLSLITLAIASFVALVKWERGIYLIVFMAFLQDPLRKLVTGEPAYFNLFTGSTFCAAAAGAVLTRAAISPGEIAGWQQNLQRPFVAYASVVAIYTFYSLFIYGNPMISGLGLISYMAPLGALFVAHAFFILGGSARIQAFLLLYLTCGVFALSTLLLEMSGFDARVLGEVGVGIRIYDLGTILHAFIVSLGVVTGRRKFIVMIAMFGGVYVGSIALLIARARAYVMSAAVIGLAAYGIVLVGLQPDETGVLTTPYGEDYGLYVQRTSGVFADIGERFAHLGIAPITCAYNRFGLFGGGAGIGTQGVQHMTDELAHTGAAEGGLGKIMLELGVLGLLAVAALVVAFVRHIHRLLVDLARTSAEHTRLACGLVALLIANMASFSVAVQAFGDIFVMLFLGMCLGSLLAMPRIARNGAAGSFRPAEVCLATVRSPSDNAAPAPILLVLTSHPIQYQTPLYRALAQRLECEVLFAHRATTEDQAKAGFGEAFDWDVDLLAGYRSRFLGNRALLPSAQRFLGTDIRDFGAILETRRPTAVLCMGWHLRAYWQMIWACTRRGIPVLVRGESQLATPRHWLKRAAKSVPYRFLRKAFSGYLYIGQRIRAYLLHYGADARRLFFSPYVVDNHWFADRARAAEESLPGLRAAKAIGAATKIVLFCGKLIDKKRPLDLIAAMAHVRERHGPVALLIAGSGPLEAECRELAQRLDVPLHVLGFQNHTELPQWYALADLLVLPSDGGETWGLVVNEAMACGTPVVVSDAVGCGPNLVEPYLTGLTFPLGDRRALGDAIARMLPAKQDPRVQQALAAKMQAYSIETAVDGIAAAVAATAPAPNR